MEIVGLYGPKSRVLARGDHAAWARACCVEEDRRTERTANRHGVPVPPGTAVPGRRLEMAARVRVNVGFWKVAARVVKGETLPHIPYIKGVKDLV